MHILEVDGLILAIPGDVLMASKFFLAYSSYLLDYSRDVYTPKIFNFFHEEYKKSLDMVVNTCYDISPLF